MSGQPEKGLLFITQSTNKKDTFLCTHKKIGHCLQKIISLQDLMHTYSNIPCESENMYKCRPCPFILISNSTQILSRF